MGKKNYTAKKCGRNVVLAFDTGPVWKTDNKTLCCILAPTAKKNVNPELREVGGKDEQNGTSFLCVLLTTWLTGRWGGYDGRSTFVIKQIPGMPKISA